MPLMLVFEQTMWQEESNNAMARKNNIVQGINPPSDT